MKSSHKSPLILIHEKNMELKSAKRRVGSGGWNPCTYISKTPPGKETKFRLHLDTLRLLSVWGILRWRSNLKPNLENISLLPLSPCLQMGSEDFSANEGKGFKQRSFQTCRRTEGSYSVSIRDIFLVLLFPDLLESHLHGTLKDLQLELQEGMEISLQNASVASPDLENSKVFSFSQC